MQEIFNMHIPYTFFTCLGIRFFPYLNVIQVFHARDLDKRSIR